MSTATDRPDLQGSSAPEHLVYTLPAHAEQLCDLSERQTGLAACADLAPQFVAANVQEELGRLHVGVGLADVLEELEGVGRLGEHVNRLLTTQDDVKGVLTI